MDENMLAELKTIASGAWAFLSAYLVVNATLVSTLLGIAMFIIVVTFHILNYKLNKRREERLLEEHKAKMAGFSQRVADVPIAHPERRKNPE